MGVERKRKAYFCFRIASQIFVQLWLKKWHAFYSVSRLSCCYFLPRLDWPRVKKETPLSSVNAGYGYDKASSKRGRDDDSCPALGKVVATYFTLKNLTVGYTSPSYQTSSNLFFSYGAIGKQLYSSCSPT